MKTSLLVLSAFLLTACNENTDNKTESVQQQYEVTEDSHSHEAPNGGVLTELGEHSASLEWLIEDGQLKVYIFDGCAENPIRVAQEKIELSLKADDERQIALLPVINKLTGEKPGDSNTFYADVSGLTEDKVLELKVRSVTIQGTDYKNINLKVK